jgi:hypothetical protein
MSYSLDYYTPINRWSQFHTGGEVSPEQAALNEGARRMYVARQRAMARHRLTPWFSNSEATAISARSRPATDELPTPRRLALPPPAAAVMGWLQ